MALLLINPQSPFPLIPSSHHLPLMAPSKPLNPYADPFLSPSPPCLPPPHVGDSPVLGFGNFFYPRPAMPCFWQFHTYPAVSCYNAWPLMIRPPCPAATDGCGGGAVADSKTVLKTNCGRFRREFLVSCGPRSLTKSPPNWVARELVDGVGHAGENPVEISGYSSGDGSGNGVTTVMIKNIPNQFKRRDLLQLLDTFCQVMNNRRGSSPDFCLSEYDFVYLPMDFRRSWYEGKVSNLGYAFVNFTTSMAASKFCAAYNNHKWDVNVNKKICVITHARIQGKEALRNAFKNKIFWCRTDQYLPVMLSPASNGHCRYRRVNVGRRIPCVPRKPLKKSVDV